MIHPGVLDPSPVPTPGLARTPHGKSIDFDAVVAEAGMMQVVSTRCPPLVKIHAGERDFRVPHPGRSVYCIGGATLPADPKARAREVMRRLAYGFLDWAARETVSRYHRDLKRPPVTARKTRDLPVIVQVRRIVKGNPGISVGEIALRTGIAQPNVSRALSALKETGHVMVRRNSRISECHVPDVDPDTGMTLTHRTGPG